RVAPHVAQLRDVQAHLQELAEAVEFPEDAAWRLAEAEEAMAVQGATIKLHRELLESLQRQMAALTPDDAILEQAMAVEALTAQGHACAQHRQKIARAQQQLQALLSNAAAIATQLHWPTDETALRALVPTQLALKTLGGILEQRGALLQARGSAKQSLDRAQAALVKLQQQESAPAVPALSPELPAALQEALVMKASPARQRTLQTAQTLAIAQLEAALAALSTWRMDVATLARLQLPADEQVAALKAERSGLANALETSRLQYEQAQEQSRQSTLALEQFAASHSVVTLDEIREARTQRDALWGRIKQEQELLAKAAPRLDRAIVDADRLVDSQRDHVADSTRLLSLRQEKDRDAAAAGARQHQCAEAKQALADFETRWTKLAQTAGLPGMPLLDLSNWQLQRRGALDAASALQSRTAELVAEQAAEATAADTLRVALLASGVTAVESEALPVLCNRADDLIRKRQAAEVAAEQRAGLAVEAQTEITHQQQALDASVLSLEQWQNRWVEAVKSAGFEGDWLTPDSARHAIELAVQVLNLLSQADDLRQREIQAMQQELAEFDAAAEALAPALDRSGEDAFAWAQALTQRLQRAREVHQACTRLSGEILSCDAQVRTADAALATTHASLSSLYVLARSESHTVLRTQIADSDRRRALDSELQKHRQAILNDGDGLSLNDLVTACDDVVPETLKSRLEELDLELSTLVGRQTRLATELAQTQAEVDKVNGGADAAQAESKRLESLAQLGDAAERYMTVSAGHRLLRWAIDRYRERKQGPLLLRASELFSRLTLGSFARLVPDFEVTPPRLIAVRATGEHVGIDGLSEGTRDQLFLALRLAALEMQIDSDRPLPFIADDLFVNFHDSRSRAGLAALGDLARKTQVIFLTHHEHLVEVARESIHSEINVVELM
ncbi:MAG: hypothetical protein KDA51_15760, partial [Planctomycetales bacterium]|nr:hypothetical protein [Planctomycetales bacterium]